MPRSPQDNQQLKDARRIEILRAASRVFAKKGFVATKISDIAREAGLSHGLAYHYFENKEAVFTAILEDKLATMRSAMAEEDALTGSSYDQLHASISRWLDRTQQEPEMGLMIAQAMLSDSLPHEIRDMMSKHAKWALAYSAERIREGQQRGEIGTHAGADEIATSLMCIIRGLSLITMAGSPLACAAPSVDTIMRLVLPGRVLAERERSAEVRPLPRRRAISLPVAATKAAARTRSLPKKIKTGEAPPRAPAKAPAKTARKATR